jgi:hypothetical protein
VEVVDYPPEIGRGARAMRNGGGKNEPLGMGGFFPGGGRDGGPPEHPGPPRAVERDEGGVSADRTALCHGLPVWLVVKDNPEQG